MKTPKSFAAALSQVSMPLVFNPYMDCCAVHDLPAAASIRRGNLQRFLESSMDARVDTIWIARDLGYRGGRRTGVPLTDEIHLEKAGVLSGGIRLNRATVGPLVAERTATVIWNVLAEVREPTMLWNVFPFHPYAEGDSFSNRCHTKAEREATWPLLTALLSMIKPRRIVAIGRDAEIALSDLEIPVNLVRHPSYGGQNEFISGVRKIYGVSETKVEGEVPTLPLFEDHLSNLAAA